MLGHHWLQDRSCSRTALERHRLTRLNSSRAHREQCTLTRSGDACVTGAQPVTGKRGRPRCGRSLQPTQLLVLHPPGSRRSCCTQHRTASAAGPAGRSPHGAPRAQLCNMLLCCCGSCCCSTQTESDERVQATGLARCCLAPPAVRQGAAGALAGVLPRGAGGRGGDSDEEQWARADAPAPNGRRGLGSGRPLAAPAGERALLPGVCAPRAAVGGPAPWPTPPSRGAARAAGAGARSGEPVAPTPPQKDAAGLVESSVTPTVPTTPPDGKEGAAACSVVAAFRTSQHSGGTGAGACAAQASAAPPPARSAGSGAIAPTEAELPPAEPTPQAADTSGRETHDRDTRALPVTVDKTPSPGASIPLPAAPAAPAEDAPGATAQPGKQEGQATAPGGVAGRTTPVQLMSLAGCAPARAACGEQTSPRDSPPGCSERRAARGAAAAGLADGRQAALLLEAAALVSADVRRARAPCLQAAGRTGSTRRASCGMQRLTMRRAQLQAAGAARARVCAAHASRRGGRWEVARMGASWSECLEEATGAMAAMAGRLDALEVRPPPRAPCVKSAQQLGHCGAHARERSYMAARAQDSLRRARPGCIS